MYYCTYMYISYLLFNIFCTMVSHFFKDVISCAIYIAPEVSCAYQCNMFIAQEVMCSTSKLPLGTLLVHSFY